jgi:UDP-2,3-diacylglucosamine hydrolase
MSVPITTLKKNTKQTFVFTSDIHLSRKTPAITQAFLLFCEQIHRSAPDRLYILGDLFDVWIGDDEKSRYNQQIITAIKNISSNDKTAVFLQVGNRDFLLSNNFAQQANLTLLADEEVISLGDSSTPQRILLCHGDQLCSDDVDYQKFRLRSRTSEWRQNALERPLWQRKIIGRLLRYRSKRAQRKKTLDIMDINEQTVLKIFAQYQVDYLIHGHTHRPQQHQHGDKTRWVLDAWHTAENSLWLTELPDSSLHGKIK